MSEQPTLEAEDARIDLGGRPLHSRLSVTSSAERLALLGDWSALFRLLAGQAVLAAGSLRVGGLAVPLAVEQGQVGLVELDPVLPPAWTAEHLLGLGAELAGQPRKAAQRSAFEVLASLGLSELAARRVGHLHVAERRALLVAHATLTDPRVLCLEQPLLGLDSSAEQLLLAVIERACTGRRLVVALSGPQHSAGERELLLRCQDTRLLAAGVVVSEEPATAKSRVTATVCRNHHAFAAALASRGLTAHATHEAGILNALTSPHAGPAWRYLVELTEGSTAGVLDAALETDAGLVELTKT